MILDVGCGSHPRGDVNIDYNIGWTLEGGDQKSKGIFINPKRIKNFILADAQFLPIRDNTFEEVVSYHTIEHVSSPSQMLRELIRVANAKITILCPHRFGKYAKMPFHKHYFNVAWFRRILKDLKCTYEITVTKYRHFPHRYIHILCLPEEMKVEILKNRV